MPLKLPAGLAITAPPPRRQPKPHDAADGLAGGRVVVVGYGRGRTSTFHSERAAVAEMRQLAVEALTEGEAGDRWTEESAVTLAARIWAALPEEARVALASEGWPGNPHTGWEGCREELQRWIGAGQVPHREAPF